MGLDAPEPTTGAISRCPSAGPAFYTRCLGKNSREE
jgi:hypothetical protein